MKSSIHKYVTLSLIIILILFLGYYRDFIFKTINAILQAKNLDASYTPAPSLKFLQSYSISTLFKIKWGLTILFSAAYLGITLFTVRLLFHNKTFNKVTIGAYLVMMFLSAILMLAGYIFKGSSDKMYEFSRYLMGMAQSPVILMVLIPTFKLSIKQDSNIPN